MSRSPTTTPPAAGPTAAAALPPGMRAGAGGRVLLRGPRAGGSARSRCTCSATCSTRRTRRSSPSRPGCGPSAHARLRADDRADGRRRVSRSTPTRCSPCCPRGPAPGGRTWPGRWSRRAWSRRWTRRSRSCCYTGSPYYVQKADTPVGDGGRDGARRGRGRGVRAPAGPASRPRGGRPRDRELAAAGLGGAGGRPPRPRPGRPRAPARPRGGAGPGGHRVERLPRHEQDDPVAAETTDPAQFEALLARAARASRSSRADRRLPSPSVHLARGLHRDWTRMPGGSRAAVGVRATVRSWTAATQLGLDALDPAFAPARWSASPRPGSRPGPTAPAATG